jgi:hypothetical protein
MASEPSRTDGIDEDGVDEDGTDEEVWAAAGAAGDSATAA